MSIRVSIKPKCLGNLGLNPVLLQYPIGSEDKFLGVVDLIEMTANYFEGAKGETRVGRDSQGDDLGSHQPGVLHESSCVCVLTQASSDRF